jgi:hypothetical protein
MKTTRALQELLARRGAVKVPRASILDGATP